jgi:hypothetical protein
MKERLGPCGICGEMVYEDEGEFVEKDGAEVPEHYECEDDE